MTTQYKSSAPISHLRGRERRLRPSSSPPPKAQNSAEYQNYLSRAGEDSEEHYDVKIEASKLLLSNTENTFTTPVFNGSTSLRDAAGQMIEDVTKSIRRRQTVNDAYMDKLFTDVNALYRLDQISISASGGKADLGPLPPTSVALLTTLGAVWVLILVYLLFDLVRRKKRKE
jgi:multiple sugar transport system substrate-binding protein